MDPNQKISKDSGTLLTDPSVYRRLIGRLLYLTHTRPDICYAVRNLSQFLSAPTKVHYQAALKVLWFLKKIPGLRYFLLHRLLPILKRVHWFRLGSLSWYLVLCDWFFASFLATPLSLGRAINSQQYLDHHQKLSIEHLPKLPVKHNGFHTLCKMFNFLIQIRLCCTVIISLHFI